MKGEIPECLLCVGMQPGTRWRSSHCFALFWVPPILLHCACQKMQDHQSDLLQHLDCQRASKTSTDHNQRGISIMIVQLFPINNFQFRPTNVRADTFPLFDPYSLKPAGVPLLERVGCKCWTLSGLQISQVLFFSLLWWIHSALQFSVHAVAS